MSQEGFFAVKLCELEQQYGQTLQRLHTYQEADHETVRQELMQMLQECREAELLLQKRVSTSRSPAVAAMSEAQRDYYRRIQQILREGLSKCVPGAPGKFSADQVEAFCLYGEYAIDFAIQTTRQALVSVLTAVDIQMNFEEQQEESQ